MLHKISGFTNDQIEAFAKKKLKPAADVHTDGLTCFAAVINLVGQHDAGQYQIALTGTYRHVSSKHVAFSGRIPVPIQSPICSGGHAVASQLCRIEYFAHALQAAETG